MTIQKNLTYLVVEDFGSLGRAYVETGDDEADRETLISNFLSGQFDRPLRIVAFDPDQCDASKVLAQEIVDRAWSDGVSLTSGVLDFCESNGAQIPEIFHAA